MDKVDKKELHCIIDEVPDDWTEDVKALLKEFLERRKQVEYEDEELSEEEIQDLEESEKDIQAGRVKPWSQVKQEMGL